MNFFKTVRSFTILSLLILAPLYAYKSDENLPPREAVEFQKSVQELEKQRVKAHEELTAKGGSTAQHKMIDDEALAKARSLETKRTSSLKKLGKEAGVGEIKQGKYGTEPTKGRGAFGDVDTSNYSGKDFEKIRAAAKNANYNVSVDGDTMYIKELDTTVHREPSKYKSKTGSSAADAEAAGGYGKETSRKLKTGDKTTEVLDNLGKSGNTLNKPTQGYNKMKSSDWQEMGKMTQRNMEAANIVDKDFSDKLTMLKDGYRPESVGIDDMDAFQQKCRQMNIQAAKQVRTEAKIKEVKLKEKLTQAQSDLQKAQQSGNQKKIRETTNEVKRTQNEIAEHSQTQKAAEDSLKKNQPKEAKDILEETKPPAKEEIDDMIKQERSGKKTKAPSDADDLAQKPKASSDAEDLMGKPGKQPKSAAPATGKKTYVKVVKDAVTGAATVIVIFSTAEDIKQKLKEGDAKGVGKFIADNLTGGAITITEQNIEKYGDYQEMKNKVAYANEMEYEAYVLKAGLNLRENRVSAEEVEKIMDAMRRGDQSSFERKRSELQKVGKNISVTPPKHIDNIGGDEDIITRSADVFIAIGDGILAMPGKAKKFLSETASDVYEITSGLSEKGVLAELYNQKVEATQNILDIAKKEYYTYNVNKEIEEQKEQKDKFKQQQEIREKLMAQGLSFEKANAIAKKATDGDWSDFKKVRLDIQAKKDAEAIAKKFNVQESDLKDFFNCICRIGEGSLGGYHNPEGGCFAVGPLNVWKAPARTSKKDLLACRNLIDWEHYIKDKKIFEEMKKNDELVYQIMKIIVQEDNAKGVSEILNEIKELIKTQRQTWEEDTLKAAQLFNNIRTSLLEKDIQAVQEILTPRLRNLAQTNISEGNLEEAIKKLKLSIASGGNRVGNATSDLQQCEKWFEPWKNTRTKEFPAIRNDVRDGKVVTAGKKVKDIGFKMSAQGGNQLPPLSTNKEWNELRDSVSRKTTEMDQHLYETMTKASNFTYTQKDPKSALKLIEAFPKSWEIRRVDLDRDKEYYVEQIHKAEDLAREGETFLQRKALSDALNRFQESIKIQKDPAIQRKIGELLKNHERAIANKKEGDAYVKEQKLLKALSVYKISVTQWPDPNLDNLIAQLEQQLQAQREQELTDTKKEAEEKKRIAAEKIKQEQLVAEAQKREKLTAKNLKIEQDAKDREAARVKAAEAEAQRNAALAGEDHYDPPKNSNPSSIVGQWAINANGYKGTMTIRSSGYGYTGSLNLRSPENLTNINFSNGTITFTRPSCGQKYTGTVRGNSITGTFDKVYSWMANRTSGGDNSNTNNSGSADDDRSQKATASFQVIVEKPSVAAKSATKSPAAKTEAKTLTLAPVNMLGEWNHVGNGFSTKLIVKKQQGNSFSGVMHGDPLINGVISGNKVTFTRDIPQRQDYTGTITINPDGSMAMSGTFTQKGIVNRVYNWSSSKSSSPKTGGAAVAAKSATKSPVAKTEAKTLTLAPVNMLGEWNHVGNGFSTKLIVKKQQGNSFSGVMHGDPLINGVISGNKVTFTRDIPQRQDYTGTITINPDGSMAMSGTFTQKGIVNRVYNWSSSKSS